MKITSRSILSPGRAGSARPQPPTTLTPSLSRRLKTSRSIKGGASPAMFPTNGRKRGSGFDNPEPSSPKVTCIGQVRVKSKKKHAKNNTTSSLSRKRKLDHSLSRTHSQHLECLHSQRSNNQRWVNLPLTICEALRTFGSEVSCLFPCRSSCSNTNSNTMIDKEENMECEKERSCSDIFARWLAAFNDHDDDNVVKSRRHVFDDDIDNGNDSIMGSIDDDVMSLRRHVFDDLDIVNIDEGRVSICVPPKNALLLMRCRSDPMMMEALTNRFWEPNVEINEEEEVEEFVDEIIDQEHCDLEKFEVDQEIVELKMEIEMEESVQREEIEQNVEMEAIYVPDENDQENETIESNIEKVNEEDESMFLWCLFDEIENQDEGFKDDDDDEEEEEEDAQLDMGYALELLFAIQDIQEFEAGESNIEKVKPLEEENDDMVTENETNERIVMESEKVENDVVVRENDERDKSIKELPECLLLMMYEPKLSMEVSKETWVCSSDFIRRRSSRKKPPQPQLPPVELINGQDQSMVKCSSPSVTAQECDNNVMRIGAVQDQQPVLNQPGRSSCSFHTRPLMATVLEEKLVNTMGYEPLVLTRCNSEPMRIAEAKLKHDACYWKNKLEPPRRASFSISMAGLGF